MTRRVCGVNGSGAQTMLLRTRGSDDGRTRGDGRRLTSAQGASHGSGSGSVAVETRPARRSSKQRAGSMGENWCAH